jgi:hypothetical protein
MMPAIAGQDRLPMAFAGLWEGFEWPDGTVTARSPSSPRMPMR